MLELFEQKYYTPYISNIIENQQIEFGLARIHSHRHISRCLIYADWYCKYFQLKEFDNLHLYFAVAFHDMGRTTELIDHSTIGSVNKARVFMESVGISNEIINATCFIIENKDVSHNENIYKKILHDVDCLDIMRPSTGIGGICAFNNSYLELLKENPQQQLNYVHLAWKLITFTEIDLYETNNCLRLMNDNLKDIWSNEF